VINSKPKTENETRRKQTTVTAANIVLNHL